MKKTFQTALCLMALTLGLASCHSSAKKAEQSDSVKVVTPEKKNFTDTINGKAVSLYTLKNKSGLTAYITNYGGRIVGLVVPDKSGKPTDVVVGHAGGGYPLNMVVHLAGNGALAHHHSICIRFYLFCRFGFNCFFRESLLNFLLQNRRIHRFFQKILRTQFHAKKTNFTSSSSRPRAPDA